jgi:hypothetical protein
VRSIFAFLLLGSCTSSAPKVDDPLQDIGRADARDLATKNLICIPVSKQICRSSGCIVGQKGPLESIRWTPSRSLYQRCGGGRCDPYKPIQGVSGVFTNLSLPENGLLARIAQDGAYMELVTQGNVAVIYHGKCTEDKEDND